MITPETFVQYKNLPNYNSMFGNIGKDWNNPLPNDLFIRGVPKVINRQFTRVNSSGAGPDTLHTFTIPAKTLKAGDLVEYWAGGGWAGNDTDKFVHGEFGNLVYENGGALDIDGSGWVLCSRILVVDVTHVNITHFVVAGAVSLDSGNVVNTFGLGAIVIVRTLNNTAINNMDSNDSVVRIRSVAGAGAAANDIFQDTSEIKLTRF